MDHVFDDYGHFAAAADSQPHMDGEMISQTGDMSFNAFKIL